MTLHNIARDLQTNIHRSPGTVTVEVLCLAYEPSIKKILALALTRLELRVLLHYANSPVLQIRLFLRRQGKVFCMLIKNPAVKYMMHPRPLPRVITTH
jgi:hypothetical protein